MDKHKIWTEHHQISWDDTSPSGRLNLTGLNIFLQRAAVDHAEHLGFGFQETSKQNFSWVLINLRVQINKLPRWRDKIRLETWPKSMEKLTATREFIMYSEDGNEVLCRASSDWILIDLDTRKPQRMEIMSRFSTILTPKNALTTDFKKLNRKQEFAELFTVVPRYSSLDMNGHTNARKYFDWLDDAIYQKFGSQRFSQVQMSYYHECKFGEEISIQIGKEEQKTIRGWKNKTGEPAFVAAVSFA